MTDQNLPPDGGTRGEFVGRIRRENRQHLRILEEAAYNGWQIPPEAAAALPREIMAIASDPNASPRDRIRATELLATLRKHDCEAAVNLDRIIRLDEGSATDRIQIVQDIPDGALQAVAAALAPKAPPCPAKPRRKR
jgi:hypothetical protein